MTIIPTCVLVLSYTIVHYYSNIINIDIVIIAIFTKDNNILSLSYHDNQFVELFTLLVSYVKIINMKTCNILSRLYLGRFFTTIFGKQNITVPIIV